MVGSRAREGARVVAGGALREDEKKAARERGRSRVGGSGARAGGVSDDDGGWDGPSFADVVEDEASEERSDCRSARDVGQILFPPTSD